MASADNVKKKIQYIISECNKISGSDQKTLGMALLAVIFALDPLNIQITENGTYNPSDYGANCIGTVQVEVPDRYQEGYDTGLAEGNMNADIRYQEGYDMGRNDGHTEGYTEGYDMGRNEGYNEATANLPPERTEADVTLTDTDFGHTTIDIPQGIYMTDIHINHLADVLLPWGWVISEGQAITKLYFNPQWANDFFDPPRSMDEELRNASYRYYDFNGIQMGEYDLFVGKTEDGQSIVCAFFDVTALQPGLYIIGVGNVSNMTIIYSTQDFDYTAQGLPFAANAGWNTAEADFLCTISRIGDIYKGAYWAFVSRVPVRFGDVQTEAMADIRLADGISRVQSISQIDLRESAHSASDVLIPAQVQAAGQVRAIENVAPENIRTAARAQAFVEGKRRIQADAGIQAATAFPKTDMLAHGAALAYPEPIGAVSTVRPVETGQGQALRTDAKQSIFSRATASANSLPRQLAGAEKKTYTISSTAAGTLRSRDVSAEKSTGITAACALDLAWLPQVLVDGGLWLRQVYDDPVLLENGALEVT